MSKQLKTILVVDDEQDLREIIEMSLQSEGYATHSAEGGNQALKIVAEKSIDAIITDIRMPDGDGVFLLKNIVEHFPKILVYIITGFADYPPSELIEIGAKGVLSKPFEIKKLFSMLEDGLMPKNV